MKFNLPTFLLVFLLAFTQIDCFAQLSQFNQTMSSSVYGQPALAGFRESPVLGWQYNNQRNAWKSSMMSISVPTKKLGFQAAWMGDQAYGAGFNSLTIGVNKTLDVKAMKLSVALGLEGARRTLGFGPLAFPNKLHDRFSNGDARPRAYLPQRQLAYFLSVAMDYKGLMLFATTRGRSLASTNGWGSSAQTNLGLGYTMTKGDWRFQALGTYTRYGSWNIGNEMIAARYRFIELGIGGQQTPGGNTRPKMQIGAVTNRFKLSYVYLNRNDGYCVWLPEYTSHEHEISFLISIHKKGKKADFALL